MTDIIIIGAGTAGMSAAIYAARAGKKVLVLEGESFGGQIVYAPRVENYPGIRQISGAEFASGLTEQVLSLGVEMEMETVLSIRRLEEEAGHPKGFAVRTGEGEHCCKSLILAAGVRHRHLGLDREEELLGAGVSYCAVCDGAFYQDQDVAVAGGGNTALQDALFLSSYCRSVTVIHRRDTFRGEQRLVEQSCSEAECDLLSRFGGRDARRGGCAIRTGPARAGWIVPPAGSDRTLCRSGAGALQPALCRCGRARPKRFYRRGGELRHLRAGRLCRGRLPHQIGACVSFPPPQPTGPSPALPRASIANRCKPKAAIGCRSVRRWLWLWNAA